MKRFLPFFSILWIISFQLWNSPFIFSQAYTNELKVKLPKPDQYKLMKAETFISQGNSILSNDLASINIATIKDEKQLDEYYANRIKASYCFRNGNGLYFEIFDKHIKAFWKNYKGDKRSLGKVLRVEVVTYDSLIKADRLRAIAESKTFIEDVIPLVSRAEAIESRALMRLGKLLFVYLNLPKEPNVPWLLSDVQNLPEVPGIDYNTQTTNTATSDSLEIKSAQLAASLSSSMQISGDQLDNFNEFLKKNYSRKGEASSIDFDRLYNTVIDSLHQQWHKYQSIGNLTTDTVKTSPFARKDAAIVSADNNRDTTKSQASAKTEAITYKVQIALSKDKLTPQELKAIYDGNEKIEETFENGMYKYALGAFATSNEADKFSQLLNVKGSVVIGVPVK